MKVDSTDRCRSELSVVVAYVFDSGRARMVSGTSTGGMLAKVLAVIKDASTCAIEEGSVLLNKKR